MRTVKAKHLITFLSLTSLITLGTSCGKKTDTSASLGSTGTSSTPVSVVNSTAFSGPCTGVSSPSVMQVWLDAGNLATANGAGVGAWNDCANAGFALSQATAAKKPIYASSGGPANRPYLSFDGTQQYLAGGTTHINFTSGFTGFFMVSFADYTADFSMHPLMTDDPANTGVDLFVFKDNIVPSIGNQGASNSGSGTYAPNTWYLITFVLNPSKTAIEEYQNGIPTGVDTYAAPFTANDTNLNLFTNSGHGIFTNGKMAEMLLFNAGLSDADLDKVTCYLSTKYNLGIWYCN